MGNILERAISCAQKSDVAFTKFITANDVGMTGGHQAGFHIHKSAWPLFFETPGVKGRNKDKFIKINWQETFETDSRFIYYGAGTRNEYRLTRFGRGFPFLNDENVGDLLVLCKIEEGFYNAYILSTDAEIDAFIAALNFSFSEINGIIPKQEEITAENKLILCYNAFISHLKEQFPPTTVLAENARNCYNSSFGINENSVLKHPDKIILNWLDAEFQLFKTLENHRYSYIITKPFESVESLIETANTILNRRKSRAGKSLELHLSEIFRKFGISYTTQATTEGNKKPDFLFPSAEAYADINFPEEKLVMLAAKTTCKDRWRQILNEADRIKTKHLFTLQQGISSNQLQEMIDYNVKLVVPEPYRNSFPREYREKISSLQEFLCEITID